MGVPSSGSTACDFLRVRPSANPADFLVGALGNKGEETLFQQWATTFETYLSATAGAALGGRSFQLVHLNFTSAHAAAAHNCVDLVFVNPAMFSCMELEHQATAIATLVNFRRGFQLDRYHGVIFTRADRADINTLEDAQDKIVEAASISSLGAAQLQWQELLANGMDFLNMPAQIRFSHDQEKIVHDVIAGHADVGMIRTDVAEGLADKGLIDMADIRVLHQQDDPDFPFLHSTRLAAPEWPLAVSPLPHRMTLLICALGAVKNVTEAVRAALLQMQPDNVAAVTGLYAGWRPAVSYLGINRMLSNLNFIADDKCVLGEDLYESVTCPSNSMKLPREAFLQSCSEQVVSEEHFACPENYDCVCRPCVQLPRKQIVISVDVWHHEEAGVNVFMHHDEHIGGDTGVGMGLGTELEVPEHFTQAPRKTHCKKLETCALASRLDYMWVDIHDTWGPFREDLGLVLMSSVRYRWWSNTMDSGSGNASSVEPLAWVEIPPPEGEHYSFLFALDANSVGNHILEIEYKIGNASFVQAEDSPIVIALVDGKCSPLKEPEGGTNFWISVAVAVPCALLLTAGVVLFLIYSKYKHRRGDLVWQINPEDLVFHEEPELLGTSSSGAPVLKAEYFGTAVAVKQLLTRRTAPSRRTLALPEHADATSSSPLGLLKGGAMRGSSGSDSVPPPEARSGICHRFKAALALATTFKRGAAAATDGCRFPGEGALQQLEEALPPPAPEEWRSSDRTSRCGMVSLRHPNITTVMGIAEAAGEPPQLVMEYMEHGSLAALLQNETVPLEPDTKHNMAEGISRGMLYLHSQTPPVVHGSLSAGNVLIDSEFRAKLSDYALYRTLSIKRRQKRHTGPIQYLAPELLRNGLVEPSPTSDVYAMGVLLFELFSRTQAFTDVAHSIIRAEARISSCVKPEPSRRGARQSLDIRKGNVLSKVFPQHIVEALASGQKIAPEHHDSVTIFFSDIIGFTDISRTMSPVDVMDMLDRLYLEFDTLAEREGVFKVETIGDAYMAVANLAQPQADHALRVARFAFGAVAAANAVPVKLDDPSLGTVSIRVGFHTGPVVASVVGKLNPRYCLFGDTVNTAARMESNSEKNMIHCSEKSAKILMDNLSVEVALECRGAMPIKGKGNMITYWVKPAMAGQASIVHTDVAASVSASAMPAMLE
eukprot:jgi/Tetstr1/439183/TSEL_027628.t1